MADVVAVAVAAVVVQLVFRQRVDLPAHVVAGGGGALVVAVLVPRALHRVVAAVAVVVVLVVAAVIEAAEVGLTDLGDVAFSGAGALLVARSAEEACLGGRRRGLVAAVGVVGLVVGFGLRHGR